MKEYLNEISLKLRKNSFYLKKILFQGLHVFLKLLKIAIFQNLL